MNNLNYIIIFILLALPAISNAQGKITTVKECIDTALQNHPDLQISNENWKKAVADYRTIKAQNSIQIAGQIETKEYNLDATSDSTIAGKDTDIGIQLGLAASYSLYDHKKIKQTQAARTSLDLSKINQMKVKNDIIYNVKRAYYNFLMARENLTLRKKLYDNNKNKLELTQKLFKSGQRPILDVSKAEVGNAEAILDYEKAKNSLRTASMKLNMAMGIKDIGQDFLPVEIEKLPELKYTYEELVKLANIYNTDLQTIQINKLIDKYKIEIERAERYPRIELYFLFGYENKSVYRNDSLKGFIDEENWQIKIAPSLRIRLPIYTGGAISSKVDAAITNFNKDIYQERQTQINLENMILDDMRSLEELQKQLQMSELIIENAKKNYQLASKSYESGTISLLDLQDSQMRVISAEIGYINTKYQYLLTIAQLAIKIGLEEEYLCKLP